MAALLPTILSDDEAAEISSSKFNSNGKKKKSSKESSVKQTKTLKIKVVDSDDDGESSNDEMDGDFEFGGLLVSESSKHHMCMDIDIAFVNCRCTTLFKIQY